MPLIIAAAGVALPRGISGARSEARSGARLNPDARGLGGTGLLAEAATDAAGANFDTARGIDTQGGRTHGANRHARFAGLLFLMAAEARRVIDHGDAHVDRLDLIDDFERPGGTCVHARQTLADDAGGLSGEDVGQSRGAGGIGVEADTRHRACRDAVAATAAGISKGTAGQCPGWR